MKFALYLKALQEKLVLPSGKVRSVIEFNNEQIATDFISVSNTRKVTNQTEFTDQIRSVFDSYFCYFFEKLVYLINFFTTEFSR